MGVAFHSCVVLDQYDCAKLQDDSVGVKMFCKMQNDSIPKLQDDSIPKPAVACFPAWCLGELAPQPTSALFCARPETKDQ